MMIADALGVIIEGYRDNDGVGNYALTLGYCTFGAPFL